MSPLPASWRPISDDRNAEDAGWPSIVDELFAIIAFRERLAIKRKARGRNRRKLARRRTPGVCR